MKTLLITALLAIQASAADIRLAWDASETVGVTNYVLYAHTVPLVYTNRMDGLIINMGTNRVALLNALTKDRWYFAATAMMDGMESDLSNVVSVQVPGPPTNMRRLQGNQ